MFKLCYLKAETDVEETPAKVWRGCLTQYIVCLFLFVSRETLKGDYMNILKKIHLLLKRKKCKCNCLLCMYWKHCYNDFIESKERFLK